ncbi:hydrogenase maturation protease [Anaeropeptidivorans aminofermentans]|uniref:hydrogenase maturation protease n=1 Tax=Anaeropeptidivorans aminofermentans TaxID=2934315 RepID=UPI002024DF6B|nr:hydrogenase maturation protease [Anaeropeptidivorans aminofermentans]
MRKLLVIGIGSMIMKDDGIGSRVVEAIKDRLKEYDIEAVVGETDFNYCFGRISLEDFVIIIDASYHEIKPGTLSIMTLEEALQYRSKLRTQHEFSLLDMIDQNLPEVKGYFIGIEVAEIGFGFELSKTLNENFRNICDSVLEEIIKIKEEN